MKHLLLLKLTLAIFASGLVSCSSLQSSLANLHGPLDTPPIVKANQATTTTKTKSNTASNTASTTPKAKKRFALPFTSKKSKAITAARSTTSTQPSTSWKTSKSTKTLKSATAAADSKKAADLKAAKAEKKAKAEALAWKRKKEAEKKKAAAKYKPLVRKKIDPSAPPLDEQVPTLGILPSLTPGDSTAVETIDNAGLELPDDIAALPSIPSLPIKKIIPESLTIPDLLKTAEPTPPADSAE